VRLVPLSDGRGAASLRIICRTLGPKMEEVQGGEYAHVMSGFASPTPHQTIITALKSLENRSVSTTETD
jgi:hypothetical protein